MCRKSSPAESAMVREFQPAPAPPADPRDSAREGAL
jgi:hypothetical protein